MPSPIQSFGSGSRKKEYEENSSSPIFCNNTTNTTKSSPDPAAPPCERPPLSKPRTTRRISKVTLWGFFTLLLIFKVTHLAWDRYAVLLHITKDSFFDTPAFPDGRPSFLPHWMTPETTQLACYSHKTDGRHIPLQSALATGCIGIEIGVYPSGGELLVGTTPETLSRGQNLQTLYLDPLLQILRQKSMKPRSLASDPDIGAENHPGAFANDPSRTLVLSVDFKADPDQLWDLLVAQLEPLREAGLLTCANGTSVIQAPVTVVATGKAPFHRILESSTPRHVFFDAPLLALTSSPPLHHPQEAAYNNQNSYFASADLNEAIGFLSFNQFSEHQLSRLRLQVQQSHSRGLKIQYRGTPSWPYGPRNQIWRTLVREGVDVITVKDFENVVQRNSRKHRGWWS